MLWVRSWLHLDQGRLYPLPRLRLSSQANQGRMTLSAGQALEAQLPDEELRRLLELGRRFGPHGVAALLVLTDDRGKKHHLTLNVGRRGDVAMKVNTEWEVTPEFSVVGQFEKVR